MALEHYISDKAGADRKRALSNKRAQVLFFIKEQVAATGKFPSARTIASRMGWRNETSAADVLHALAAEGHIRRLGREADGFKKIIWGLVP